MLKCRGAAPVKPILVNLFNTRDVLQNITSSGVKVHEISDFPLCTGNFDWSVRRSGDTLFSLEPFFPPSPARKLKNKIPL